MTMKYRAILFDLDGTLVTMEMDFKGLRIELEAIYRSYGMRQEDITWGRATIDSIKEFRRRMDDQGLPGREALEAVKQRIHSYELEQAPKAQAIPGAVGLLSWLRDEGYRIAVATRNNRDAAWCSMENTGILPFVDLLVARDDVQRMKPHPEQFERVFEALGIAPAETLVVGDYTFEIEAGRALGCHTVGVLTGTGTREDLADADIVIPSVADLRSYLKYKLINNS